MCYACDKKLVDTSWRILFFTYPVICQYSEKEDKASISYIYLQDGSHKDWQTSQNKHKGSSDSLFPETKSKDYQSTSCFHKHALVFSPSNKKTLHWPNRYFTKVWISYVINTSRTAYRLNRTIKFSKLLQWVIWIHQGKKVILLNPLSFRIRVKKSLALGQSVTGLYETLFSFLNKLYHYIITPSKETVITLPHILINNQLREFPKCNKSHQSHFQINNNKSNF